MTQMQDQVDEAMTRLLAAGTDLQDIEVKAAGGGLPRGAIESICAFANAGGGLLLLGLDERLGFEPVPIDAAKLASDLASTCTDDLEPAIRPDISIATVRDQPVVAALVEPLSADRRPCFVKAKGMERGAFLRTHDGDRRLSTYEVHVLLASRGQSVEDAQPVLGTSVDDLDPRLLEPFLRRLRTTRGPVFEHASDDEILRLMRVVIPTQADTALSLAGLMTLGRYPQQFFPQLDVTFVAYPTANGEPLADHTRFLDNQSIDGPIPTMVAAAVSALRRNSKRRSIVMGLGREDQWEYPEDVMRELVANALMHRDYHPLAQGTQVRVELYPDRLEIHSPGGLFGPIAPEDLLTEPVSSSRNALLAKLLEDVEIPGTGRTVCENRGSGLLSAAASLRRAGLEPPQLRDSVREFRVVVPNHGLLDDDAVSWLSGIETAGLNDPQRLALAFLRRHREITNQQYRTITGVDALTATRELTGLAGRGLISKSSDRRWARWHLTEAETPGVVQGSLVFEEGTPNGRQDRRRQILKALANGSRSSHELAESLGMTREGVLKWLRRMETDGEVAPTEVRRRSRSNRWQLR